MGERTNRRALYMVPKNTLYLISGGIWALVGLMLTNYARVWLAEFEGDKVWAYYLSGIALALIKYKFVFIRVDNRNSKRICSMENRVSLFRFIPASSYFLISVMMATGIVLKTSKLPHEYLAILYTGIGLSLILSSYRYFRQYIRASRND